MSALADLARLARAERLAVLGAFHDAGDTVAMLGPDEPAGFWPHFTASAEARDGGPDPLDRWSARVIGEIAGAMDARAHFPFGGPPYEPFQTWALRTGRIHESPVRLLVHDVAGLWVSFRGAVRMPGQAPLSAPPPNPCDGCRDKPCLTACPVGALTGDGYDLARCHGYLDSAAGTHCMKMGCAVRAACPVSRKFARLPEQSAYHMSRFHPS